MFVLFLGLVDKLDLVKSIDAFNQSHYNDSANTNEYHIPNILDSADAIPHNNGVANMKI